jgi:ammonia channel protein AmtB
MLRRGLDDPLDAVAVHVGGGSVGVIGVHIFAYGKGILWTASIKPFFSLCDID